MVFVIIGGMNYGVHYDRLIERAWFRSLDGYTESHHVTPECMCRCGVTVNLTPEEHYVAHQLLVKMYPDNDGLAFAALMMSRVSGNKAYGWLRCRVSKAMMGNKRGVGRVVSIEQREKTSRRSIGNKYSVGKKLSKESREKISKALSGKSKSDEHIRKLSNARKGVSPSNKGVPCSEETKRKISETLKGRKASRETRRKMSESRKGLMAGIPGHRQSDETRCKISKALKGRKKSKETRRRMSLAQRGNKHALGLKRGPMSEEHKAKILESRRRDKGEKE